MANPNEMAPELSQESQWETQQEATPPEIEFDLDVLAHIMKGVVSEPPRRVGEMRLVKIAAQEGGDLFHNGFKIQAKTVLIMVDGKSEPELLAREYAHTINDGTLKVMFDCIGSAVQFRQFSDELYGYHNDMKEIRDGSHRGRQKIVEPPKEQAVPEVAETSQSHEMEGIRKEVEDTLKPRF